jgi:hypothetical protein
VIAQKLALLKGGSEWVFNSNFDVFEKTENLTQSGKDRKDNLFKLGGFFSAPLRLCAKTYFFMEFSALSLEL